MLNERKGFKTILMAYHVRKPRVTFGHGSHVTNNMMLAGIFKLNILNNLSYRR